MKKFLKSILVLLSLSLAVSTAQAEKTKILDLNKDKLELSGDGKVDTFKLDGVTVTTDIKKYDKGYYGSSKDKTRHHSHLKIEFDKNSIGYTILMKNITVGKIGCTDLDYKMTDAYGESIYFIRDYNSNFKIHGKTIHLRKDTDFKWKISKKTLDFFVKGEKVSTISLRDMDGIKTFDIPICLDQDYFQNLIIIKN